MPAVAKTTDERILAAARKLVEQQGADALSMQALGERVGVRAPSLYKRFPHRDAILDGVLEGVLVELGAEMRAAAHGRSPAQDLARMAEVYRAFALQRPHLYALIFRRGASVAIDTQRRSTVEPLFTTLAAWLSRDKVLPAARTLVAWLHGFVSMELDQAFHLGDGVDEAFAFGLRTLIGALAPSKA